MFRVKEIKFFDSVQYQIFETSGKKRSASIGLEPEDFEPDTSYVKEFLVKKKQNKVFMQNPFNDDKWEYLEEIKEVDEDKVSESVRCSMSRTIKKIYDVGRSNEWEWFFTLTFNPDIVDSLDYSICSQKLSYWLNNMRKTCPAMKYLVVPEQHESGRWHFHGLFSNVSELEFNLSGKYTDDGKEIFNVGNYKLGWSTAIKLDGDFAIVGYMTKYITKSLCEMTKGRKRYWYSRNCDLPIIDVFDLEESFESVINRFDLSEARILTKQGYVDVTYIDSFTPIYSKNMCLFTESETGFL